MFVNVYKSYQVFRNIKNEWFWLVCFLDELLATRPNGNNEFSSWLSADEPPCPINKILYFHDLLDETDFIQLALFDWIELFAFRSKDTISVHVIVHSILRKYFFEIPLPNDPNVKIIPNEYLWSVTTSLVTLCSIEFYRLCR